MKEYNYIVAGHLFTVRSVGTGDLTPLLGPYVPFKAEGPVDAEPVFVLDVVPADELPFPQQLEEEFTQDDDGSQIRLCRAGKDAYWFEFSIFGQLSGRMLATSDFRSARMAILSHPDFAVSNSMMVLYALSTALKGTALFHAAVIGHEGRGYLFLGKSGTGKSTHARLWLKHIPGAELVNDDNPVVRVLEDGTVRVYGSPWSGKTPCYRNMDLPVGGFVHLAQAPYNKITRLRGIRGYAVLVSSISGQRWNPVIADGLHETENALVAKVPVWQLDCLPDEAAARLCCETVEA